MRLCRVILNVRAPQELARFYETHLGMGAARDGDVWRVGYGGASASIELRPATSGSTYVHASTDRYWKIGVTLPNVDLAYSQLRSAGVPVSVPTQFRDIGYLCHLSDPEGFQVELLQHTFRDNRPAGAGDAGEPLGGGARIGQVTLRVTDIEAALSKYRGQLGMRLLSVQDVPDPGFTLYFLAFTAESPPNPALDSVDNREWLWRRPYTTLELQHVPSRSLSDIATDNRPGFVGIVVGDSTTERLIG